FNLKNDVFELGLRIFKNHNALKELAEKEDVYNPIIICALLSKVENLKTLKLLHTLTWLKAKALNRNPFFYKVIDRILENAKQGFDDENLLDETARRVKKELTLKRTKLFLEQNAILQDKITHIKSNLFIIKNTFEDIVEIARFAKENDFKFWFSNSTNLSLQIVAFKDFKIEIVLTALANLNLVFMNLFELFDDKIYLRFEYDNIITDEQKNKLCELLNSNLSGFSSRKIKKPIIKKDELKLDLNYSKIYAKLSLNTKDQQGLMAYMMNIFNELGLVLSAAKIQTIRQRTRNTFIFQKNENLEKNEEKLLISLISE
ncbi:nucleotidyltransferase, partial [Campylobacter coli]|nr:nucleotidyltransferase [Campylobacter coli]EAK2909069.1 nucleotidyltransferase [Campylobacter coli]EAL4587783.1 nucleotidyltransferase [Campylobacter coli]EAL5144907.1 nucleotidyltransferase [Campylobacter coli]EAL7965898.1 nucleotidyltransferase [Campylobacter coli]